MNVDITIRLASVQAVMMELGAPKAAGVCMAAADEIKSLRAQLAEARQQLATCCAVAGEVALGVGERARARA